MNIPKWIIVHHTGGTDLNPFFNTSNHTLETVDAYHKSLGWDGIGYNWFIEKSGLCRKGRDENKAGAHCLGYNEQSIGICLAGNFDSTLPTQPQIDSLTKLLKEKMVQYNISAENIVPHRKFANKSCYGKKLSDTWASDLIKPNKEAIKAQIISLLGQL